MSTTPVGFSRRKLLTGAGATALSLSLFGLSGPVVADSSDTLPFRKNAPKLLLHFNENALGMSPKALMAAQEAVQKGGNRYADADVSLLREMLAKQHGVPTNQILLGNGSTEIIRAAVTWAANVGATLIEAKPTFGDASRNARAFGVPVKQVPVAKGFQTDLKAMRQTAKQTSGPLLINLCTPNNPTGTVANADAIEAWIKDAPAHNMFLIDEAYHDFAVGTAGYRSMDALVQAGQENVLVARTFSKVYGMAGMRVGYGIAAPETAKKVGPFATVYNLNAGGAAAAVASLKDKVFHAESIASNAKAKKIATDTLDELGLEYIPSATNFVLHRINSDLDSYKKRMAVNGILVGRRMTEEDGWNRLSMGTPDEMKIFVRALKAFRQKSWA